MSKWNAIQSQNIPKKSRKKITIDEAVEKAVAKKEDGGEELAKFIRDRMLQRERQLAIASSDYYFVVCFDSDEERIECCNLLSVDPTHAYFDGREVAKRLGVKITEPEKILPGIKKPAKGDSERVMDFSNYSSTIIIGDGKHE